MTDQVDSLLFEGLAALVAGKPKVALEKLQRAREEDPDDGDIRHALGRVYEAMGDVKAMKREFLQTRVLDAEADRRSGLGTPEQLELIERVAANVLEAIPDPFASKLSGVPVVLQRRPSLSMVQSGFDPRALGVFDGPNTLEGSFEVTPELPPQIIIFTHNLLAEFDNEEELARQIEITLMHEIGHFFGLDEDDMHRLGLE